MVIGVLQFDLLIHDAQSLKDKRRVVSSLKDRLHREHQVSVAEVALQDNRSIARLGLALVGSDGGYVGQTLDRITAKLRETPDAELGDVSREIIQGTGTEGAASDPDARDAALDAEMLRHAGDAGAGERP